MCKNTENGIYSIYISRGDNCEFQFEETRNMLEAFLSFTPLSLNFRISEAFLAFPRCKFFVKNYATCSNVIFFVVSVHTRKYITFRTKICNLQCR